MILIVMRAGRRSGPGMVGWHGGSRKHGFARLYNVGFSREGAERSCSRFWKKRGVTWDMCGGYESVHDQYVRATARSHTRQSWRRWNGPTLAPRRGGLNAAYHEHGMDALDPPTKAKHAAAHGSDQSTTNKGTGAQGDAAGW